MEYEIDLTTDEILDVSIGDENEQIEAFLEALDYPSHYPALDEHNYQMREENRLCLPPLLPIYPSLEDNQRSLPALIRQPNERRYYRYEPQLLARFEQNYIYNLYREIEQCYAPVLPPRDPPIPRKPGNDERLFPQQFEMLNPGLLLIYQAPEEEQILIPERASCLAVTTYLRMCQLPFKEETSPNVEFMSLEGRFTHLPVMRFVDQVFVEFEPIVNYVEKFLEPNGLSYWMNEEQRELMDCVISITNNTCTLIELFKIYNEPNLYKDYTRDPSTILQYYEWDKVSDQYAESQFLEVLHLLDNLLRKQERNELRPDYIYGQQLCQLDAIIFGHLTTILTTKLPSFTLGETVRAFPRLVDYCKRIDNRFYEGKHLET